MNWRKLILKKSPGRSGNKVVIFMPINRISQLEVILYSNPRCGVAPNNKFTFSKSARRDFKSDFF